MKNIFRGIFIFCMFLAVTSGAYAASKAYTITRSGNNAAPIMSQSGVAYSVRSLGGKASLYYYSFATDQSFLIDKNAYTGDFVPVQLCDGSDRNNPYRCIIWVNDLQQVCIQEYDQKNCFDGGNLPNAPSIKLINGMGHQAWWISNGKTLNRSELYQYSRTISKDIFDVPVGNVQAVAFGNEVYVISEKGMQRHTWNSLTSSIDSVTINSPFNSSNIPNSIAIDQVRFPYTRMMWLTPGKNGLSYCDLGMISGPLECVEHVIAGNTYSLAGLAANWGYVAYHIGDARNSTLVVYDQLNNKEITRIPNVGRFDMSEGQIVYERNGQIYYQDAEFNKSRNASIRISDLENSCRNCGIGNQTF